MLRNLLRSKKEKKKEEGVEFQEKISEISQEIDKLSKQQFELEEKVSQLSEEISLIREKISENSKKIAIENSERITAFERKSTTIKEKIELKKEKNRFIPLIRKMVKEGKSVPESRGFHFILAILEILPKKATIDSPCSFWDLVDSLWLHLYSRKKGYSRNDCRDALSALINFTDVLKVRHRRKHPQSLFVFNEKSKFYWDWAPLFIFIPSQK